MADFDAAWNQFKGRIKKEWGELTDDEITETRGEVDELIGIIQEQTEERREEIEARLRAFSERHGYDLYGEAGSEERFGEERDRNVEDIELGFDVEGHEEDPEESRYEEGTS